MPKISPRESVREHPLYRAAMAAQHAAYQLMRDVPPASKSDAARLHALLVHATAWVTTFVDEGAPPAGRSAAGEALAVSAARAKELLGPLAPLANDAGIVEALEKPLEELQEAGGNRTPVPP